ncbi:hypothetical protein [Mesorhizobium sp. M00.F.Ca.ET.216.01.1.1]|uniref:hypothetical protein n=1 Tax=Mesorhizobium sp. M00.F.Ca.ET.216.01.1.1 TaxID=2500528 RepID=UPI001FDF98CB|nr:hypothetical protein [Mesorhizobium sp. M00.F.Ca.ET.216.01.1.1]
MDCFQKIEALIEVGGTDAVEEARKMLSSFKGSQATTQAIEDFLIDLMTLVFLVETGRDAFQNAARHLARKRLSKIKLHALLHDLHQIEPGCA